ncbi:hypothetical protein [Pseudogemmobacter sonorensis]|uniref:hypothetical protein n=1 Tax=Pseudogemmobacter sonorensis TaxID=2989681 RepID=UPI0036A8DDDB
MQEKPRWRWPLTRVGTFGLILALVLGLGVFGWWQVRNAVQGLFSGLPGAQGPARVEMLDGRDPASGRVALVLEDFVTGSGPRLIRDPEVLARLAPDLWYMDQTSVGSMIGQATLTLMGMPPVQRIGTLLEDGAAVRDFTCLSVDCIGWRGKDDRSLWGLGALSAAPPPGEPVEQVTGWYDTHDAYLAAHARAAEDPLTWFAKPGGGTPDPGDDGMRGILVTLPTVISASPPRFDAPPDQEAQAELETLARGWIEGSSARIEGIHATGPNPFWVLKDDDRLHDENGSRTLPDLSWHSAEISLQLPEAEVETLLSRIGATDRPAPETALIAPAIARAFALWGLDTACLPGCGAIDRNRITTAIDIYVTPAPHWQLPLWRLLP